MGTGKRFACMKIEKVNNNNNSSISDGLSVYDIEMKLKAPFRVELKMSLVFQDLSF